MALAAGLAAQAPPPATVRLPLQQATLANGLRVILSPDTSAPTVSLCLTYDVGSRNERRGHTGLAHLFEHLMYEGTPQVPKGEFFRLISTYGANLNGTTNQDRTNYFETLPANQLDLGLYLEADRMRSLPLGLSQAKLDDERQAVEEERRLRTDNVAYGRSDELVDELAYDTFGYQHPVVGSMADLKAASLADVVAFFKTYYAPNNCVLTLVGDFEPGAALAQVKQYFGDIPAQAAPPPPDMAEPPQRQERRQTVTDAFARLPRIVLAYRIPDGNAPDWYALNVLGDILTRGRASRLSQTLVQEQHLALTVRANPTQMRGPGLFELEAMLRPGKKMAELERGIEEGVAQVAAAGVSQAEVNRAVKLDYTDILSSLRGTLDRAVSMGTYAVYFHQPELVYSIYGRFRGVTPQEVQRVAAQYFAANNRTVVITLPAPAAGKKR